AGGVRFAARHSITGGSQVFKSILAISEGGPDAAMAFRLAGEVAGLSSGSVEAVHYPTAPSAMADGLVGGMSGAVVAWDEKRAAERAGVSKAAFDKELGGKPGNSFLAVDRQDI